MRVGRIHRTLQEAGSELAGKRIPARDKEAMDASQDRGDDMDAVFPLLADAYIIFLAQVETELGRKFKSARDALNYINRIYVAVNHLLKALVSRDANNELVAEGDVIKIHSRGEWREYDIIQVSRTGWINDTDKFTGYELDVVRRDKYTPDRKTGS